MATNTPANWEERIPLFDEGDPLTGREATLLTADGQNIWRALAMGLAQSHALPANATHAQIMEAFMQGHALTGEIKTFGGAAAPGGWLLCNGARVSSTTYAALFGALGQRYAPDVLLSAAFALTTARSLESMGFLKWGQGAL